MIRSDSTEATIANAHVIDLATRFEILSKDNAVPSQALALLPFRCIYATDSRASRETSPSCNLRTVSRTCASKRGDNRLSVSLMLRIHDFVVRIPNWAANLNLNLTWFDICQIVIKIFIYSNSFRSKIMRDCFISSVFLFLSLSQWPSLSNWLIK